MKKEDLVHELEYHKTELMERYEGYRNSLANTIITISPKDYIGMIDNDIIFRRMKETASEIVEIDVKLRTIRAID